MSGKKIFITGGSGYIGTQIITQAIAAGYTVTALSRTSTSDNKLTKLGATPIRGDLKTHSVLTEASSKADVAISLADSIADNYQMDQDERFAINNAAVDAMAEGLKGSGKCLILTSGSLHTGPDPNGEETDESSPGWPEGSPFKSGAEARNLKWKEHGIRTCSVRLAPYVYGRGGSGVALFMKQFVGAGAGVYIGDGHWPTTTVHVDDAARLYLLVAEKGRSGEAYNATAETTVTQKQLAEAICKAVELPCASMPFEVAKEKMGFFFAMFLSAENRAGHAKAMREFGWEPKAEKGILEEIETGSYVEVAKALKEGKA